MRRSSYGCLLPLLQPAPQEPGTPRHPHDWIYLRRRQRKRTGTCGGGSEKAASSVRRWGGGLSLRQSQARFLGARNEEIDHSDGNFLQVDFFYTNNFNIFAQNNAEYSLKAT